MLYNDLNKIQSVIRLYIPFHIHHSSFLRTRAVLNDWKIDSSLQMGFYLGYISRIFNAKGINSDCLVLKKELNGCHFRYQKYAFQIESTRLFSFDTGTSFLELRIPFDSYNLDDPANLLAGLRLSDTRTFSRDGEALGLCINDIVHELLSGLGSYNLFDHLASGGATRPELFVSLIMDDIGEELDMHSCRIASGLDNRYKESPEDAERFSMFPYIRWTITDRGVCNIGLHTDNEQNNDFVSNYWFSHSDHRYVIWYILALHQKYSLYHFLNDIAEKNNVHNLKRIQEKIMVFNTKYRFSVISEEVSYQKLYEKMSEVVGLETILNDIDDEVERITEYYESVSAKNNTISMTILSLVCAVTVIREFYDFIAVNDLMKTLLESMEKLSADALFLFLIFCLFLVISLIILLPKAWFFTCLRKAYSLILKFLFRNKI